MTDAPAFDPETIAVAPGDTVVWENVGAVGHPVTAYEDEIPADADYFASGGSDTESAARSAYAPGDPDSGDVAGGASHEHTFVVEGRYGSFCVPHETVGMVGEVVVGGGGGTPPGDGADDGPGGSAPTGVPEAARRVAIAATGAALTAVGFAYVLPKYGGDYGTSEDDEA